MWAELISAVAFHESGWKPTSRMKEPGLGTDPVTGQTVWSEGLLQLSYQDTEWARFCRFDWNRDKDLAPNDPAKTILDPALNLDCGVRILAGQIHRTHFVVLASGVYWSVLKEGGNHTKVAEIAAMTKKLPFCGV